METPEEQIVPIAARPPQKRLGCLVTGVICLCVLLTGIVGAIILIKATPEAEKETEVETVPIVRIITAQLSDEQLYVRTQGQVIPHSRTQAAAEVMGRVIRVSGQFKTGGIFAKGDIMLELDKSNYVAVLARAQATLADAKLLDAQETARATQAMRDWKKLGRGEAPDLVARKPQIASANARVTSAEADVARAVRDLDRTKLRAPYACRVEATYTDDGSYVSPGARLADLYSMNDLELRLPVALEDFAYLTNQENKKAVTFVDAEAKIGGELRSWKAEVSRSEGQVDRKTMMVNLVAKLKPNKDEKTFPLPPVGLFVQAQIKGKLLTNIIAMPRSALTAENTVLVLKKDNTLAIKSVEIARTLQRTVLVSSGLSAGDRIITSPIETPVPGMKLKPAEASNK